MWMYKFSISIIWLVVLKGHIMLQFDNLWFEYTALDYYGKMKFECLVFDKLKLL